MKDWKVCVYAICKNEMKFLDKWLDSMSEADYVVVLDTGSTDGSYEFLKNDPRCTRVEQKIINPWRFDVARDESMKLVPEDTDIYVCTDPDELFRPGWCKVLKERWKEGTDRGFYTYAWNHDPSGAPMNVFKYDKIHTKDYHWKYPVHEVLWPNNKDLGEQKGIEFGEDIYLDHWQDLSKDRRNYLDILKIAVSENPEDCHIFHLYAREYILQNQHEEARKLFLKLLLMKNISDPIYREVHLDSLLMLSELASVKGDLEESIYWCDQFLRIDSTFREPYLTVANIYNTQGDYARAEYVINEMNRLCYRHYSWVEKQANWTYTENAVLGDSYYGQERYEEALQQVDICLKHDPNNIDFLKRKINCIEKLLNK